MLDTIRKSRIIAAAAISALFIAVAFVGVVRGSAAQKSSDKDGGSPPAVYTVRLISPAPGDVLVAGQRTTVTWEASVSKGFELTWCEQELYLSIDGGQTAAMRISPQLDPRAHSFEWTVPNSPTDMAVLDLRFGCEGTYPETAHPQTASTFIIAGGIPKPTVSIRSLGRSEAAPGEKVTIGWDSSVDDVAFYEIKVSYDQGAHFHRLAKTDKTEYTWKVPADMAGHATFKVVAHTNGGELVESVTSARPDLLLRRSAE